jgi:hypothetical protein
MNRRRYLAVVGSLVVAGCTGAGSDTPTASNDDPQQCDCPTPTETTPQPATALRLVSVGQDVSSAGDEVTVLGSVSNTAPQPIDEATVTVSLLSDGEEIQSRTISLGEMLADESADFSTTFGVNASRVTGRRITFG